MNSSFSKIVAKTLVWEGGFVDNPNDPGGRTNKGITQKEYNSYRTRKGLPAADVLNIGDDEVQDIYYNDYFLQVHADLLEGFIKVQWKIFDIGVNMGVGRAIKFVQTIIGVVPDGQWGPKSQNALVLYQGPAGWDDNMMSQLVHMQVQRYNDLVVANPKLSVFLHGWLKRGNDTGDDLE